MEISSGSRLGPYQLASRIGAGGMGEVWRARDTRLERDVAIKVLPKEFAQNDQLKLRLEREAKAISQLNHPNICTLYDVGESGGTSFLVMELLEGDTLADRIAKGPLPLHDVLRYGAQIAEALDRAHRAGIVHRDLKPGNVMLTRAGAKLLDFGLAKSAPLEFSGEGATQQRPLTQEGTILGTFQYMAPEQLEGDAADARTDLFALGVVLYEMATGKRAFEGKTKTSLIAAIVSSQPPPVSQVQPLAPTVLDHVISKCLEKNRDDRWQSAHDVAEELKWIASGQAVEQTRARPRPWPLWSALAFLTLLAVASTALYVGERNKRREPVSFEILPPPQHSFDDPVISPDGKTIAFQATPRSGEPEQAIWIRHLASLQAIKITDKGAVKDLSNIFWSPDGKSLGFFDQSKLMKLPLEGGRPEVVCKANYGVGAAWSPSGTILFSPKFAEGLFRAPASGGEAVRVTTLDARRRETLHGWPKFLTDGKHFLFLIHTIGEDKNEIYAGALGSNLKKFVTKADSLVGYWNKRLLFVRDGSMYAQRFSESDLTVTGDAQKIIDDVYFSEDSAHSFASVANDGAILYRPASRLLSHREVGWYDRTGQLIEKLFEDVSIAAFRLSPDESKIAMTRFDRTKGADDIFSFDLTRGVSTKISSGLSNHSFPLWSPAGDRIFFNSDRDGMYDIYAQSEDGTSPAEAIWKGGDDKNVMDVSVDGRSMLANLYSAKTRRDIWLVPLTAGEKPRLLVATDGADDGARFSPDGKWITYSSDRSGRNETYVRGFPDGRSIQISTAGGTDPEWSHDGSEIYILTSDRTMASIALRIEGGLPRPGKPVIMFRWPKTMTYFSPSRRPDRFLGCAITDPEEAHTLVHYVYGWDRKIAR